MKKPIETVTGVPTVTLRTSYLRILPLAQELIGATVDDRLCVRECPDSGNVQIGLLPMTSEEDGINLCLSHGNLQSKSLRYGELENGNYTLNGPTFDDEIDWWTLVKL